MSLFIGKDTIGDAIMHITSTGTSKESMDSGPIPSTVFHSKDDTIRFATFDCTSSRSEFVVDGKTCATIDLSLSVDSIVYFQSFDPIAWTYSYSSIFPFGHFLGQAPGENSFIWVNKEILTSGDVYDQDGYKVPNDYRLKPSSEYHYLYTGASPILLSEFEGFMFMSINRVTGEIIAKDPSQNSIVISDSSLFLGDVDFARLSYISKDTGNTDGRVVMNDLSGVLSQYLWPADYYHRHELKMYNGISCTVNSLAASNNKFSLLNISPHNNPTVSMGLTNGGVDSLTVNGFNNFFNPTNYTSLLRYKGASDWISVPYNLNGAYDMITSYSTWPSGASSRLYHDFSIGLVEDDVFMILVKNEISYSFPVTSHSGLLRYKDNTLIMVKLNSTIAGVSTYAPDFGNGAGFFAPGNGVSFIRMFSGVIRCYYYTEYDSAAAAGTNKVFGSGSQFRVIKL